MNIIVRGKLSRYDGVNRLFELVYRGLEDLGTTPTVYGYVKNKKKRYFFPNVPVNLVSKQEISNLFNKDTVVLAIDDYELIRIFSEIPGIERKKLIIWAHNFQGHKYLFKQYRKLPVQFKSYKSKINRLYEFLPPFVFNLYMTKYVNVLQDSTVLAQSLWTYLLLTRVYNIKCKEIVTMPIDLKLIAENKVSQKEDKYLIFLWNSLDTDLEDLIRLMRELRARKPSMEAHSFGSVKMSEFLTEKSGIRVYHHSNLDYGKLYTLYSSSLFTICPIYNGTFEMVPIESLLSGTPIVTYYQPFMELTGTSRSIANLKDVEKTIEMISLIGSEDIKNDLSSITSIVSEKMDFHQVAKKLLSVCIEIGNRA